MTDKHPNPLKEPESAPGYGIAVAAEALYLINPMIAPGWPSSPCSPCG